MSKLGSLLGGLGMGAAAGYAKKKSQEASDARIAARVSGQPLPPPEPSLLETGISKVKSLLSGTPSTSASAAPATPTATVAPATPVTPTSTPTPVVDNRPTFNVSLEQQEALKTQGIPLPEMPEASPETVAFNDDATVPNEPTPFRNSYDA